MPQRWLGERCGYLPVLDTDVFCRGNICCGRDLYATRISAQASWQAMVVNTPHRRLLQTTQNVLNRVHSSAGRALILWKSIKLGHGRQVLGRKPSLARTACNLCWVLTLTNLMRAQVAAAILPEAPVSSATRAYSEELRGQAPPPSAESAVAVVPPTRWQRQWNEWQSKVLARCPACSPVSAGRPLSCSLASKLCSCLLAPCSLPFFCKLPHASFKVPQAVQLDL
jgi:hypothetical protein